MLHTRSEAQVAEAPAPEASASRSRLGLPVDPARVVRALRRGRRAMVVAVAVASVVGVGVAKLAVPKTYSAQATMLWQPPADAKQDARLELATIADSIKLPANLARVRERLSLRATKESLAKRVEVSLGDASMLITVKAKEDSRERAADLANALVESFLAAEREVVVARRREITDSLRASLASAEEHAAASRARYDDFRELHGIGDMSLEMQAAIEEASKLRLERDETQVELESLRAKEVELRAVEHGAPESVVVASNEQRPDLARLAQVESELASARALHAPDHPTVRALSAEAAALRTRSTQDPALVTQRTMGRNVVRDAISVQAEESSALRRAIEEKSRALDKVRTQANARTVKLTVAQGEAAARLSDVEAAEQHVAALLRQIAVADDDVRGVTSGFQIVSAATPAEHAERGIGMIVALALPALALLMTLVRSLFRELRGARLHTGREVAFYTGLPVRWTTSWPRVDAAATEGREAAREIAVALENDARVVGFVGSPAGAQSVSAIVAERLRKRGRRAVEVDLAALANPQADDVLAEALEGPKVREALGDLQTQNELVLATLPSIEDRESYRVATTLVDTVVVVVESGELGVAAALDLAKSVDFDARRILVAVIGVSPELLKPANRNIEPLSR